MGVARPQALQKPSWPTCGLESGRSRAAGTTYTGMSVAISTSTALRQRFVLKYALRFGCGITGNPRGTTACRPRTYAFRFEEFVHSEVLRLQMEQRDPLVPTYRPWR